MIAEVCGHETGRVERGLCSGCYNRARRAVWRGLVTWDELVEQELALAAKRPPRTRRDWKTLSNKVPAGVESAGHLILIALARAAGAFAREATFDRSDVVMAAWKCWPEVFGLKKYPDHPDSARVCTELSTGSLVKYRWVARCGVGRYRLTESGIAEASRLTSSKVA